MLDVLLGDCTAEALRSRSKGFLIKNTFRTLRTPCLCGEYFFTKPIPPYLNGAQAEGVINMFSCITRNSLVAGGHPSTVFEASALSRSRSPPSL